MPGSRSTVPTKALQPGPTNTRVDPIHLIQYLQIAESGHLRLYDFLKQLYSQVQSVESSLASLSDSVAPVISGAKIIEVNLGATAKFSGKFNIIDADIFNTSDVLCWQAPGPYTGKGTRFDEAEMQPVQVIAAEPYVNGVTIKWQTPPMLCRDTYPGSSGQLGLAGAPSMKDPAAVGLFSSKRFGRVRGNVKFAYMIF